MLGETQETMTRSHALLATHMASLSHLKDVIMSLRYGWSSMMAATVFIATWTASRLLPQLTPLCAPVAFLSFVWCIHTVVRMWICILAAAILLVLAGALARRWHFSESSGSQQQVVDQDQTCGQDQAQQSSLPTELPPTWDELNLMFCEGVDDESTRTNVDEIRAHLRRIRTSGQHLRIKTHQISMALATESSDISASNILGTCLKEINNAFSKIGIAIPQDIYNFEALLSTLDLTVLKNLAMALRHIQHLPRISVTGAGRTKQSIAQDVGSAVTPWLFPSSTRLTLREDVLSIQQAGEVMQLPRSRHGQAPTSAVDGQPNQPIVGAKRKLESFTTENDNDPDRPHTNCRRRVNYQNNDDEGGARELGSQMDLEEPGEGNGARDGT